MEQASRNHPVNFFFDPGGVSYKKHPTEPEIRSIGLFVGPEGGWDEKEISLAKETGFKIVSLGPLILRAETAALLASFAVLG